MMSRIPTQEELDQQEKERRLQEKAEAVSLAESNEINRRHKQYKQRAKNLARLKGADKNAIEYERELLLQRLAEIDKVLYE